MFKKIVSQLSFSPALVGQLGFYARRLRKEEATRRLGLVFVALALVVQSLVVFQAPEPSNAASPNDFIYGGLGLGSARSLNKFLGPYDRNERHLQEVFNYFGITRSEITATTFGHFKAAGKISFGYGTRPGGTTVTITDKNYQPLIDIYGRPITAWAAPSENIYGYIGHSSKLGWFAIMQACGNLVTERIPPVPTPPAPAKIDATKSAINTSQANIDATKTTAQTNDKITYTVSAANTGGTAKQIEVVDNLRDVLTFSKLVDAGGGTFDEATMNLTWPATTLNPGAKVTHSYAVQMNSSLVTPKPDCQMHNFFMDKTVTIPVGCTTPPAKIELSKTAINVSQGNIDATSKVAKEKDRITFTLTASNAGGTPKEFVFEDDLDDTLEYAKLVDNGGASLNKKDNILSWPAVTLKPGDKQVRTFTVQILDTIPATPRGLSDRSSYNCKIENVLYTEVVSIPVDCAIPPKVVERVVTELPTTGPGENILFAGIVLAVVVFFYLRSRQLNTEVRLIRRDLNGGSI